MSLAWLFKNLLGKLLLPPGNGLLLLLIAGLGRRRRWAFGLACLATSLLLVQSLPIVAGVLISPLEERAGPVIQQAAGAQAIVILGGGLSIDAVEYGGDTANERTLLRTRYGARLAQHFGLPILVTGGKPLQAKRSEAEVMASILLNEYKLRASWIEGEAMDTAENAAYSAAMLHKVGIRRVVLVTQAFHMPRAIALFEAAGLEVVPAPTNFKSLGQQPIDGFDFLPSASALHNSYFALHEWLGLAWLRFTVDRNPAR